MLIEDIRSKNKANDSGGGLISARERKVTTSSEGGFMRGFIRKHSKRGRKLKEVSPIADLFLFI